MIICRVEDACGFGYNGDRRDNAYKSVQEFAVGSGVYWWATTYFKDGCRPIPHQDGIAKQFINKHPDWLFGFRDEKQLKRWFSPYDLYLMGLFGGCVVRYEVPDHNVCVGGRQLVFHEGSASKLDSRSLHELTWVNRLSEWWLDFEDYEEEAALYREYGYYAHNKAIAA